MPSNKVTKAIQQAKDKIILPLAGERNIEFSLSSFSTLQELTNYLTSLSGTKSLLLIFMVCQYFHLLKRQIYDQNHSL